MHSALAGAEDVAAPIDLRGAPGVLREHPCVGELAAGRDVERLDAARRAVVHVENRFVGREGEAVELGRVERALGFDRLDQRPHELRLEPDVEVHHDQLGVAVALEQPDRVAPSRVATVHLCQRPPVGSDRQIQPADHVVVGESIADEAHAREYERGVSQPRRRVERSTTRSRARLRPRRRGDGFA